MNKLFPRIEFIFLAVICLGMALLFPVELAANDESLSTNAAELLRIGTGARYPAMGNAGTGDASGGASLHYNPGGLAFSEKMDLGVMIQDRMLDMSLGTIEFVQPITSLNSAWGIGVKYLDFGKTTRTTFGSSPGISAESSGKFTGGDLSVNLSYGYRYQNLGFGFSTKLFRSEIDDADGIGIFFDAGLQWRSQEQSRAIGLVIQNGGNGIRFDKTKENVPFLIRGGISQGFWNRIFIINFDVEHVRRGDIFFMGGLEWNIMDIVSFRGGYDGRIDIDNGFTGGVGMKWDRFEFNYAFIPFGELGNNHRFSLNLRFGEGQ